jgi:methylmalonyl-CoA mutase N-terminal domain/subunit
MYRSRLWTMRQFAGFGTATDTNGRFKELLRSGGDGLSTAFDMPTLLGRDSDDPLAKGEVGRAGVAIDTLADMETLFSGIDLGSVSTSMTINSPAAVIMAMYVGVADKTGVRRAALSGTIQNDILKEYQAQKEFVFPPRPSVRLVTDLMRFAAAELPRWHPVSISGYHIREAGSTAAQELAFTLANGFAYVEAALAAGDGGRRVRPPSLLLLQRPHGLLRGDRQVPGGPAHLGPLDARPLRRHRRPVAPAAFPHPDRRGVADGPAARGQPGARGHRGPGGCAGRHPEPAHRLLRRGAGAPDRARRALALRTQQVIAEETGVVHVADPWADRGSSKS